MHLCNGSIEQYKTTQDSNLKEELLKQWLPYVRWVASKFVTFLPPCIDIEDIMSQGVIGLIRAIDTYDPKRGVKFKTYAFYKIKGAILDELRALDWKSTRVEEKMRLLETVYSKLEERLGRLPTEEEVAAELGMKKAKFYKLLDETRAPQLLYLDLQEQEELRLHDTISSPEPNILCVIQDEEIKEKLVETINKLPEREKLLITLYYYEDLTYKEIAKVIGVSESRVCQLHTEVLLYLKKVLKKLI